jgi:hypothetical protein
VEEVFAQLDAHSLDQANHQCISHEERTPRIGWTGIRPVVGEPVQSLKLYWSQSAESTVPDGNDVFEA